MVITRLLGGLGNQMFQYALGRHLSLKNNSCLNLDLSIFLKKDGINYTYRSFELGIFNIRFNDQKSYTDKIALKYFTKNIIEEGYHFQPQILNQRGHVFLRGFWQSEKYFKDIESVIRTDFSFNNKPDIKNVEFLKEINNSNSVSIHFRRGDYVNLSSAMEFHGTCTPLYYKTGIDIIRKKIENPHFYIFSDDIKWVIENFEFTDRHTFVDINHDERNCEDMRLMSACKHNIIANSSFSWWGAWLNTYKDKIVIAPNSWFKDKSKNTNDLIPAEWMRI